MRDYGDSYEIPMVLGELALAADSAGQAALGRELAEEAVATAERLRLDWFRARAALLSASLHIETPLGDARLEEALELTERLGLGILWRRRERPRAGALLARALQAGLPGAPAAARLAAECGREVLHECAERLSDPAARARLADAMGDDTDVDPETIRLLMDDPDPGVASATERVRELLERRPRQPIRIETFGGLRLYRAGDRVPDSSFGRAKARALMGALVCAEPRGVHRDRLLEHLWPELPPERGTRALDTTLHELRRTLEPLAPPRSGGSLVNREGEVYRLALGERDSWDAGDFLRLARAGEGAPDDVALERMLRAEALWRGDFLPDFPYEPWGEDAAASWSGRGWSCWSAWRAPSPRWAVREPPSSATATWWSWTASARAGTAPSCAPTRRPASGRWPCASSTPAGPRCAPASASSPAPRRASSTPRCSRPSGPSQQVAQPDRGVVDQGRPVAAAHELDLAHGGELAQGAAVGVHVGAEALPAGLEAGPGHHHVAREERPLGGPVERHAAVGVPGRVDHLSGPIMSPSPTVRSGSRAGKLTNAGRRWRYRST